MLCKWRAGDESLWKRDSLEPLLYLTQLLNTAVPVQKSLRHGVHGDRLSAWRLDVPEFRMARSCGRYRYGTVRALAWTCRTPETTENPLGWRHAKTGMGREPCSPLPALRRRTRPRAPESLSTGAVMGAVRPCRALSARGLNKTQQTAQSRA